MFSFSFSDDEHDDYDDFEDLRPFSFDSSTPTLTHPGQSNYLKNRGNSVESFIGNKTNSRSQLIKEQDEEYRSSLQVDQKKDEVIIICFIKYKSQELLLRQSDPSYKFAK